MRLFLAASLFAFGASAAAQGPAAPAAAAVPASRPLAEVPLTLDGRYALLPVSVGGVDSLMFILDSAAGGTVLAPAVRDTLGFTESDGEIATIVGASGETQHQTLTLDALTIGGHTERHFGVTVIPLQRFQQSGVRYAGILGNDLLQRFDVEFDLPGRRLRLWAKGTVPAERLAGFTAVPFTNREEGDGFVRLDGTLGGGPVGLILDTGAGRSVFNPAAAALEGATPGSDRVRRHETPTSGLGSAAATETSLYTFADLQTGGVAFTPSEVRIADLPIFRVLGYESRPGIIAGNDVLGQRPVFLLYSTRTAYFGPPPR